VKGKSYLFSISRKRHAMVRLLLQCFILFNSFEGIQDPKQDIEKNV